MGDRDSKDALSSLSQRIAFAPVGTDPRCDKEWSPVPAELPDDITSFTARVPILDLDREVFSLVFGEQPAPEPEGQPMSVVIDTLEEWDGPQRPRPSTSWWRRILGRRAHRRAVARWRSQRSEWIAAGCPPRAVRTVIPRAFIEENDTPQP